MSANCVGEGFIHLTKNAYMRKLNKKLKCRNGTVPSVERIFMVAVLKIVQKLILKINKKYDE